MKRIITLMLVAIMCLSLVACGGRNDVKANSDGNDVKSENNEIELNADNILDYLKFEITYTRSDEKNVFGNPVMERTINIYPVRDGGFSNVELLITDWPQGWTAKSSEIGSSFVKTDNGYTLTKIDLPSDGKYTCTHKFDAETGLSELPKDEDGSKGWDYISFSEIDERAEKMFGSDFVKAGDSCIKGTFKEN